MLLSYLSNIIKGTILFNMPSAGCTQNFLSWGMKHRKCKHILKKFSIPLIKLIFILKTHMFTRIIPMQKDFNLDINVKETSLHI